MSLNFANSRFRKESLALQFFPVSRRLLTEWKHRVWEAERAPNHKDLWSSLPEIAIVSRLITAFLAMVRTKSLHQIKRGSQFSLTDSRNTKTAALSKRANENEEKGERATKSYPRSWNPFFARSPSRDPFSALNSMTARCTTYAVVLYSPSADRKVKLSWEKRTRQSRGKGERELRPFFPSVTSNFQLVLLLFSKFSSLLPSFLCSSVECGFAREGSVFAFSISTFSEACSQCPSFAGTSCGRVVISDLPIV